MPRKITKTAAAARRSPGAATVDPAGAHGGVSTSRPRRHYRRKQHGTESEYRHGCRCDRCRGAASSARIARRARTDAARDRATLEERRDAAHAIQPTPGKRATLDAETWAAYIAARKASDEAQREALRLEVQIKEHMSDAEKLFVGRRRVATWKSAQWKAYSQPARTARRFVVTELSRFRMFKTAT